MSENSNIKDKKIDYNWWWYYWTGNSLSRIKNQYKIILVETSKNLEDC